MCKVKIGNAEFPFEWADIETKGRYVSALTTFQGACIAADEAYSKNRGDQAAQLEQYTTICKATHTFVDDLFGDGSAREALGDKFNINDCIDAVTAICASADEQAQVTQEKLNALPGTGNESK